MTLESDQSGRLLRALASPVDDEPSLDAAVQVLSSPDPRAVLEAMYPDLVAHRVLTNAIHHVERAGGDVDAVGVSNDVFRTTWPLAALFPPDHPGLSGDVSLATLRRLLAEHRRALDDELAFLMETMSAESFMALTGRAFRAGYPDYSIRMEYDADVFAWDVDAGLAMLDAVRSKRACTMHSARVFRREGGWHADIHTARRDADGRELHVDIVIGAKMGRARAIGPEPRRPRARLLRWGQGELLVPAPEDLLLWAVVQQRRRATLSLRDLNDARTVLVADRAAIDWDHLCSAATRFDVAHLVARLLTEAERATGERLAPEDVHGRLAAAAPAGGGPALEVAIRTAASETSAGRAVIPQFILAGRGRRRDVRQFVRRVTAAVRAEPRTAWRSARASAGTRLLLGRARLAGSRARGSAALLRVVRRLDLGYGSLCELRTRPKVPGEDFCLSRTAAGGRPLPRGLDASGRGILMALVEALPDRAAEENVRIRPSEDRQAWTAHRCPAFTYLVE